MTKKLEVRTRELDAQYESIFSDVAEIIEAARRSAARSVNAIMTAAYWLIGRRVVEFDQSGKKRAEYGTALIERLAVDLTRRFGRGFSRRNLQDMRLFYQTYPLERIRRTVSAKSGVSGKRQTLSAELLQIQQQQILQTPSEKSQTVSAESSLAGIASRFPLPWSAYVRLLSVKNKNARAFYETEALRGGWSVRQLDRQINSQFYERTALSKNKTAMLKKGGKALPLDVVTPEEEIKDPYVLEFLELKDEYSETDLEEALIRHLETFEWYRVDLVFFHRKLRCLVIIDLKLGKFTHADAGQMHLYLNYAREHWVHEDENPPVGLILCARKDEAVARYALEGLPNKVMAAEYRTVLPDEKTLAAEIRRTQEVLEERRSLSLMPQDKTRAKKPVGKKRTLKVAKGKRK